MTDWSHKDEWRKRGKDFLIVVSRHGGSDEYGEGPNRWCVYAYIYPKHPHFKEFFGPNMWQDAASMMPMHGGPSLLEYPQYDGKVSAVKVGCDYNHIYDTKYTHYSTKEDASEIFDDAKELYDWLQYKAEKENNHVHG